MEAVLVIGALLAIGVGAYLTPARRLKRALRRQRQIPISALPENTVGRLVGTVRAFGEPLQAPLSGRTCVYYVIRVDKDNEDSSTLIDEERGVPFVLEDDTGRAIVDPTAARVTLAFDHESDTVHATFPTPQQEAVLARHQVRSKGFMGARPLYFYEGVIEPGERVAVLGSGTREADPEASASAGYRDGPPTRLRFTSSARYPLVISDDPSTTEPA